MWRRGDRDAGNRLALTESYQGFPRCFVGRGWSAPDDHSGGVRGLVVTGTRGLPGPATRYTARVRGMTAGSAVQASGWWAGMSSHPTLKLTSAS